MAALAVKAKVASKDKDETYTCMSCGHTYTKQDGNFFKSTWSQLWNYNNKYMPVCKACLDNMMKEYTARYGSEETALKIICHYMDVPFYASLYKSIIEKNNTFSFGMYSRQILNNRQYQYKTFQNSIIDGELGKTENEVRQERESKWTKKDKQNMTYVISTVGYDPFEYMGLTDDDRKYCFNVMAGYCDTEGVKDDGHKRLACVQITTIQLQCKKFDELINEELLQASPNEGKIKNFTSSKSSLLSNMATLCKDNNISSAYNGTAKSGKNTLTQKMQEMFADGIDSVKVNLFEIETCEFMKQVADCSNRSILEQLNLDSNEYTQMVKEQREMIQSLQSELDKVKEDYRLCNNELIDLKNSGK